MDDPETTPAPDDWLDAARQGDLGRLRAGLAGGVDVNAGSRNGTTALHYASSGGHAEAVEFLLRHGADPTRRNSLDFTPLTAALIRARSFGDWWENPRPDPGPLQALLVAGAEYDLRDAVFLNDVGLARRVLDAGDNPDRGEGTYHGPVLKIAAEMGRLELVDLLLDRGANLEATDDLGQRPLHAAARHGRTAVVARLLDRGALIDPADWAGQTALAHAAAAGHREATDLLLSRGATGGPADALMLDDLERLQACLDANTDDPSFLNNVQGDTTRLLTLAARLGRVEAVRLLLDRGHPLDVRSCEPRSALAEAARHGHLAVLRLLLDRGADLNAVGTDGLPPLAWAERDGQDEAAALLLAAGAGRAPEDSR